MNPLKVEVVSPGVLPNTMTIDNIKYGIHMERNPIILSYMAKNAQFPLCGRGSGIPRVLKMCRENGVHIQFEMIP